MKTPLRFLKSLIPTVFMAVLAAFSPVSYAEDPVSDAKIVINIPSRSLWLYSGGQIVGYYPVGVGTPNFPTPIGDFLVTRKIVDPDFENPYKPPGTTPIKPGGSAHSPLGTRWIGFFEDAGGEYGIHGTNAPDSVGKFSSHGCIRMRIPDAEALFDKVDVGTPVAITYELVLVQNMDNDVSVISFPDVFGKGMPSVAEVRQRILNAYPTAKLDEQLIATALKNPSEKPVSVGTILPSAGDAYVNVMGRVSPELPEDTFAQRMNQYLDTQQHP